MIAHLTRIMIMFQLLTLVFVSLLLRQFQVFSSWTIAVLVSAVLLVLVRASIIFNNFFLSRALRQPRADGHRLALRQMASMMLSEFWFSMLCWFRLFPLARPYTHHVDEDRSCPVLLLHGYGANSGFWHCLHQRLAAEHISHGTLDLEPVLGSIDGYADRIEAAAARLLAASHASSMIVVCHSMGGLAARAWLRRCGYQHVARVITLGTPHAGSLLAGYGIGINARQMLPASAWNTEERHWLSALAASEDASVRSLFVSLWSRHDNIVMPQTSAELTGAKNIAVEGVGHVALGFDTRVVDQVMREISEVRRSRSSAGNE